MKTSDILTVCGGCIMYLSICAPLLSAPSTLYNILGLALLGVNITGVYAVVGHPRMKELQEKKHMELLKESNDELDKEIQKLKGND